MGWISRAVETPTAGVYSRASTEPYAAHVGAPPRGKWGARRTGAGPRHDLVGEPGRALGPAAIRISSAGNTGNASAIASRGSASPTRPSARQLRSRSIRSRKRRARSSARRRAASSSDSQCRRPGVQCRRDDEDLPRPARPPGVQVVQGDEQQVHFDSFRLMALFRGDPEARRLFADRGTYCCEGMPSCPGIDSGRKESSGVIEFWPVSKAAFRVA